ncbi:MAG: secretin N-terminal domain-containing protein [bacterium]
MRKLLWVLVLLGLFGVLINMALLGYAEDIPSDSRPISIDFKDIDLKDLLDILSAVTGLNIIATPEVQGTVPVARFENVPVLKALKIILEPYDYEYEIVDNIIRVSPIPLLSRSFTLKSALVAEVVSSLKPILSEVGKIELNQETNTLFITDKKKRMEEIAKTILKLDEPARQLSTHSFSLKFVQAEVIFPLIQPHLSRLGKLEVDSSTNSLSITDTSYSLSKIEKTIASLDYFRAEEKLFSLKFALASEVAQLIQGYLTPEGKFEVREDKNEILVKASPYSLEKIDHLIADLDTPPKQMKKEKFLIRYISLKDLAEVIKENISSQGKLKIDPSSSTLTVEDTAYHLFQIEKMVAKLDTFQPRKRIYKIRFAPLSLVAERVEDFLSDKGTVEIQKETSSLVVVDVRKNLKTLDKLIKQLDTIENQLIPPLEFPEIDLKEALAFLSTKTGLNIIAPPEIKGKVSARFERPTPILKALTIILEPYNYEYQVMDNIIRVSPVPLLSRSFAFKSALVAEVASSLKPLLSEVGKIELNQETNSLLITDKKERMEEIAGAILKLDEPDRQLSTHSFNLKFVQAEALFPLIQPHLSRLGKLEVDSSTNSLIITDTRYNLVRIGQLISKLDYFRPSQKLFTLKLALASEVAKTVALYLSDKGKIEVNEAENQIMVTATSHNLKKIEDLVADLDTPLKQMKQKEFLIRYTSLEEMAKVVKETLSPQGTLKKDPPSSTLTIEDTSYHLFRIEKLVARLDSFQAQKKKKTYEIRFASLSLVKERMENLLSDKGTVEIQKETSSLMVVDVRKSLDRIDKLVKEIDTLEDQLVIKRFFLKYLTPREAESELQGVISEHGKIRLPQAENVQSRSSTRDYIMIPQEGMDSPEESSLSDNKTQVGNNIIYVTDLKRNMRRIEEVVKEMNGRSEEIAVRTFHIKEGSLERIAIAIANMLGVKPEEIEGIELKEEKGKWMEMEVPSPSVNLGTIGPGE